MNTKPKKIKVEHLIQKSKTISGEEMVQVIEEAHHLLKKEKQERNGGLVYLPSKGEANVIGDLHGDLKSLKSILQTPANKFIFLGDYGDRGDYSPEVFYLLLKLKIKNPQKFILLRGNHEPPRDLPVFPSDLPYSFKKRFENGDQIHQKLFYLFQLLPHAAISTGKYLFLHGGLPQISSLQELESAQKTHPNTPYLEQILWSDPKENPGISPSRRGAGRMFGPDISQRILSSLNVRVLIRGHEPCEGIKLNHNGRVVTLFSSKGVYGNQKAAFLKLDLSELKDGHQLKKKAIYF